MFKIITDTACDFLMDYAASVDVTLIPLYITFDGETYYKDRTELSTDEFYRRITEEKIYPRTSLPSVQDYIDAYLPTVKENIPIVTICLSTALSGAVNSARMAAQQVMEDYPDAKITVINSQFISAAEGLLVYEAIRMNRDNIPYEKAVSILQKMTDIGTVYFTIGSLDYIKKGGRLGKLASMVTGILNIRPSLFLKNGEVNVSGLCRTRKKSVANVFESCKKYFTSRNIDPNTYDISVASATTPDECDELRRQVEEDFKIKCVESRERFDLRVSSITGVHTGPTTIGIGIMPKYETLL